MARLSVSLTLLSEKWTRNSRLTVLTQAAGSMARGARDRNCSCHRRLLTVRASSSPREASRFRECAASKEPRPWPCRRRSSSRRA
eukprot:15216401-Heterocapsa_arctica.AAC.1